MPTRQGWLVAGSGAVCLAAARLFGPSELYVFGVAAIALVGGATLLTSLTRLDLDVTRSADPPRLHAGGISRVDLRVRNRHRAGTRVLGLRDPVRGDTPVELFVPPLGPGATTVAHYQVPAEHRGVVRIGPLEVTVSDPFGLAQRSAIAAPEIELTVLPAIDEIRPAPSITGRDTTGRVVRPPDLGGVGDDFYALRPYVTGDDLRRVHWPSSARHDELIMAQNEPPSQGCTTVVLDVRQDVQDAASFELAVSAAASVIAASADRGDLTRLITTGGSDSGFSASATHVDAVLEHLAVIERSGRAVRPRMVDQLLRTGEGGTLVVVAGRATRQDLDALGRLDRRAGSIILVHAAAAGIGGEPPSVDTEPGVGLPVVRVHDARSFAPAWDHMLRTSGPAAR